MAMSMRLVNVRNKLTNIIISRRSLSLTDNYFSHKANTGSLEPNNEEGEDFFGISENFKLQHARHDAPVRRDRVAPVVGDGGDDVSGHDSHLPEGLNHQDDDVHSQTDSNFKRRDLPQSNTTTSFITTFGSITFDTPAHSSTMEDLAVKAQDILTKLSVDTVKHTRPSVDRQVDVPCPKEEARKLSDSDAKQEDRQSTTKDSKDTNQRSSKDTKDTNYTNKRSNVQQQVNNNKLYKPSVETVRLDSSKTPRNNNPSKSNYFDEIYFPEHSVDKNSSNMNMLLEQTSSLQFSGSKSSTGTDYPQSNNSEVHRSLSKINTIEESKIVGVTPEHRESSSVHSSNLLEEQYFGTLLNNGSKTSEQSAPTQINDSIIMSSRHLEPHKEPCQQNIEKPEVFSERTSDLNEVDQQYFGETAENVNLKKDIFQVENPPSLYEIVKTITDLPNLDKTITDLPKLDKTITDQPKLDKNKLSSTNESRHLKQHVKKWNVSSGEFELNNNTDQEQLNMKNKKPLSANLQDEHDDDRRSNEAPRHELNTEDSVLSNEDFLEMQKKRNTRPQANLDQPETAYNVAMKIRNDLKHGRETEKTSVEAEYFSEKKIIESGVKLDSKGFRVLDDQVPDLSKMTSADIVRMLKSKIIYDHEDFLAIDKPYGLPCVSQQKDRVSVTELLPAFANHLPSSYKVSNLHLVQGMDRDVTGAIILAKNPEVAYILRGMYKNSDMVTQRYWAITKGVPNPSAGLIDIPLGEAKVGNIYKMVLRPRFMKDEKLIGRASKTHSERAVTEFKVLGSHLQSALVECTLLTSVKHQIRLHLASGLGTPILGDHKYSNFSKLAPQKLYIDMLQLLKIRQPMVRNLALHLHCRSIILKDYKGQMIFLTTYPPSHFRDNLRSLKIPKPKM